jgi:hypothetical protein
MVVVRLKIKETLSVMFITYVRFLPFAELCMGSRSKEQKKRHRSSALIMRKDKKYDRS